MSGVENRVEPSGADKARSVRAMFGAIAGRYDLLNHLLSANVDRYWRRACVAEVRRRLTAGAPRILDLGCGTADLSLAFARSGAVIGCDFCRPMLAVGRRKVAAAGLESRVALVEGDALRLPFPGATFDAVVSAFVVRNLGNVEAGLAEMRRVVRPGGVVAMLDFAMPDASLLGSLYRLYFVEVLPRIGRAVSGVDGPYRYLPASVQTFPAPDRMCALMEQAGLAEPAHRLLTGGIAVVYTSVRPDR
jgi:demethylmenaquinone methyltransferase/2-methoxy-6-polyprenyl-1,4-benzoquinol methylase